MIYCCIVKGNYHGRLCSWHYFTALPIVMVKVYVCPDGGARGKVMGLMESEGFALCIYSFINGNPRRNEGTVLAR